MHHEIINIVEKNVTLAPMFTYIDPKVRKRLIDKQKLICIDCDGNPTDINSKAHEKHQFIDILGPIPLPIIQNKQKYNVDWYASVRHGELIQTENLANTLLKSDNQNSFADLVSSMSVNSILIIGDYSAWENPLVRIHSSCVTGDVFGSQRCECGPQLESALELIKSNPGGGMVIYMSGHEGRGIGLWAKAATYLLQDQGENTYQANRSLGLSEDSRNFSDAATLIKYFLGNKPFRLLTNNPKKINDLKSSGLDNIAAIKHVVGVTDTNLNYLSAKRDWGHYFEKDDLGEE